MGSRLRQGGALPTFFIIGAPKAGTTSLHYYLDQHSQIQMSAVKEPNFFAGAENGSPYPMGRISRIEEYERLFDLNVRVRGESSPTYSCYPLRQGAPERIKELVPEAKVIYLVRDPISRTLSHYHHAVAIGAEHRSLQEALRSIVDPTSWPETCYSLYASQLEQYLRHFSQDRILVIDQSDFLAHRQSTLRQVFNFLSVDDGFVSTHFNDELNKNSGRRIYPPGYERFVAHVVTPNIQWIPRRVRRSTRRSMERMLFRPLKTSALDDEMGARLREFYTDEVVRLRALTGKAFPTWSI